MDEKELLELAAQSAGLELDWAWDSGRYVSVINPQPDDYIESESVVWPEWNPLVNDGDAFRLMVAIGLTLSFTNYEAGAWLGRNYSSCEVFSDHPDKESAARYAIVRAAARLAKVV